MIKKNILFLLFIFFLSEATSQNVRVEDFKNLFGKGNPLKLNGGFSANTVANTGNSGNIRDPFTYYLNGNINLNIYGQLNLPFSFNFTNSGTSYKLPSSPNRLSIHPSYKWATGHIGDVSMVFSPYTLNGHMFTGVGVELSPDGWEFAAMYGRLLKAVEYEDLRPGFSPTYKRMGHGFKVGKITNKYRVSLNVLSAKDEVSSLIMPPDSLGVTPMENLAASVSFMYKPVKFIELTGEYGLSLLTNDMRADNDQKDGILGLWSAGNMTSTYYNALKFQASYVGDGSKFGIAYERIDPGYQTLGAYYFTNDLENITINAYQSILNKKLDVNLSLGYERDDISKIKANQNTRIIGSVNLTGTFGERIIANLMYSNFQSYSNARSNFELINQEIMYDQLDTLDYVQINQSANLNLNVITKKSEAEMHNLNVNLSYQDAANKQGGKYRPGSVTEMINASTSYTLNFLKRKFSINAALNLNNSKIYNGNTFTWGPTLGASSQLFNQKLMVSGAMSYNTSKLNSITQGDVFITRINSSYSPWKKHSITFGYNFQWRSALNRPISNNSLFTLGYNYTF